jgi:alanyl-tRNA synthetase
MVREQEDELRDVAAVFKSADLKVAERVRRLSDEAKELKKELRELKGKMTSTDPLATDSLKTINGVKVLGWIEEDKDAEDLRSLGDIIKNKIGSGVILLGSSREDKVSLICMVTKDLTGKYRAGDIIKEAAAVVGGGGGGRPDMAQAGGKDPEKLPEAVNKVYEFVEKKG